MSNYFYLQIKRVTKVWSFVLVLTVVLLITVFTILSGALQRFVSSEVNKKFSVGIAGDTDNEYFRFALSAFQAFDESRFSIEFLEMSESEAQTALEKSTVAAYVVIPENFIEHALHGEVDPITFVTSAGMDGIVGLFKKEITTLITEMVVQSQKGVYGLSDVLSANGLGALENEHMTNISIQYTELILQRNRLYSVKELGVAEGLSTIDYYICAIFVLLLSLLGLPFAAVYIKRDYAFERLLLSRGYSTKRQMAWEYLAHFLSMLFLTTVVMLIAWVSVKTMPSLSQNISFETITYTVVFKAIPIIAMLSALNLMIFELSNTIVSGVLLHFFVMVGLCYVSGCMYPIYAFPDVIKTVAFFLPTGLARIHLASAFTLSNSSFTLLSLLFYTVVFISVAWLIRFYKTVKIRG